MPNFIFKENMGLFLINLGLLLYVCKEFPKLTILAALPLIFLLYFYRMPSIDININNRYLTSPAFGTVSRILYLSNGRILVTIFLSPFDIHAQYFPCQGRVINQIYDNTGKFEIASDAYKSDNNEKMILVVDTPHDQIKITQLAGLVVRRISTPNHIGSVINQGEYLGFIKFGSRVDIEFSSDKYALLDWVHEGVTLKGPMTRIAILKN